MKAIIFNSGLGKRMGALTADSPKSMVKLENGETIFGRQIRVLSACGIKNFIITTGPHEQQLIQVAEQSQFRELNFTFVNNPDYETTNYIYSMYLAREHFDDDVLMLHGDLVFNKSFVDRMLEDPHACLAAVDKHLPLPEKDFKACLDMNRITEISVNLDGVGCFAFQPLYKLDRETLSKWTAKVVEYIEVGNDKVYAENALNEILPSLDLELLSYEDDYVEEVDTPEDLARVSAAIGMYDGMDQKIRTGLASVMQIPELLKKEGIRNPLLVCDDSFEFLSVKGYFEREKLDYVRFSEFTSNPVYEDVVKGVDLFREKGCDGILSIGGGSSIDVAKCIKLFSAMDSGRHYLKQDFVYSPVKHIAVPTTAGTGSESTQFAVVYVDGEKVSVSNGGALPDYVVLDGSLLRTLPDFQKKCAALDALCQAMESLWSVKSNKYSDAYAQKALRAITSNLFPYLNGEEQPEMEILEAANSAGHAINITTTTAAHAMSYKLTSLYGIPHGLAVALCLPFVMEYVEKNISACQDPRGEEHLRASIARICEPFEMESLGQAAQLLKDMLYVMELPVPALRSQEEMGTLVKSVNAERLGNNPVPLDEDAIRSIYEKVFALGGPRKSRRIAAWIKGTPGWADYCRTRGLKKKLRLANVKPPATRGADKLKQKIFKRVKRGSPVRKLVNAALYMKQRVQYRHFSKKFPVHSRTILFESYAGKKYTCNPRGIFEAMQENPEYASYRYVWAFNEPEKYEFLTKYNNTTVVQKDSATYRRTCTRAKYWVCNTAMSQYLVPKKEQEYIHTWHGKPIKKIGCDVGFRTAGGRGAKENKRVYTELSRKLACLFSPAPIFTKNFISAFNLKALHKEKIVKELGYPRNDALFTYTPEDIDSVKVRLGVPFGKRVVLYAPTWRPTKYQPGTGYIHQSAVDFQKLKEALGDEYVVLFRAHINEANSVDMAGLGGFLIDATRVEEINDLYIISDLMISDYSGAIYDYANLQRPMVLYMYDREEYTNDLTGVYYDLDQLPGRIVYKQEELAPAVKEQLESFRYDERYERFNTVYNALDGADCGKKVAQKLFPPIAMPSDELLRDRKKRKFLRTLKVKGAGKLRASGIYRTPNAKKLAAYKDKHKGQRCFLIGNGPSLRRADLEMIQDEISFSCNLSYKIFDTTTWHPTYHCITDAVFTGTVAEELINTIDVPFFMNDVAYKKIEGVEKHKNIIYVRSLPAEPYYVRGNFLDYYVSSRATVMSFMIELAMYMGFEEIYLLGVDCSNGFKQGGHFIREYESPEMMQIEKQRAATFVDGRDLTLEELGEQRQNRAMAAYATLWKYADAHGIKIRNATRGGELEVFERVELECVTGDIASRYVGLSNISDSMVTKELPWR